MKTLLGACRPGFELVLADIGSAGGLKDRWVPARPVVSAMLFEPREGGAPRKLGRDTLYPVALGSTPGRVPLNVTALPNMSSTLEPNAELMETFRKKGEHTAITGTVDMPVDTLDAIAAREGKQVDAIKVDTQGSELGILEGARACLSGSLFVAEIEVSFFERYRGQPLLRDVEAFMAGHGFELVDLYRLKRYRRGNSFGIGNISLGRGQRAGRLAYGDALFLLSEDSLVRRIEAEGEDLAMKAILALLVYGKADVAAALFERVRASFDARRGEVVAAYFRSLSRQQLRRNSLQHVFDYLSRHV